MTWGQRVALSTLWGVLVGLVAGVGAIAGLSYAIDKPVAGCASITISLGCLIFGGLAGAAASDI